MENFSKFTTKKFLDVMAQKGFVFKIGIDNKLKCISLAENIALTDLLRSEIKHRKREIIEILRSEENEMSFDQRRLWFLEHYEQKGISDYLVPIGWQLTGKLDITILEKSINTLIKRHASLHTIFISDNKKTQLVLPKLHIKLIPKKIEKTKLSQAFLKELQIPFNLAKGPLFRCQLYMLSQTVYVFFMIFHHIIIDGWSLNIMQKELNELYTAYSQNRVPNLVALEIQYTDYTVWQKHWIQSLGFKQQEKYWRKKLKNFSSLSLETDIPRPSIRVTEGAQLVHQIPKKLFFSLQKLCSHTRTTLFMLLLAILDVLLNKYCNQGDIIVGSVFANRKYKIFGNLLGFFVNTLPLRINNINDDLKFTELLTKVKKTCLEAQNNSNMPFDQLVNVLQVKRDPSRTPVVQVTLELMDKANQENLKFPYIKSKRLDIPYVSAKFDLTFYFSIIENNADLIIDYNRTLYSEHTIKRFAEYFISLMETITDNPKVTIGDISLLINTEFEQIVDKWTTTDQTFPRNETIHGLVEEQVKKTPKAVAIVYGGEKLTYQELNAKANQLAHRLRKLTKGMGKETLRDELIGLCIERSIEMAIGILGILKAGGAYVPLDPEYPKERLNFILKDTRSKIILTQKHLKERLNFLSVKGREVICLDSDWQEIAKEPKKNLKLINKATDLMYVIYTSGSTGKPKGAMLEHRGIVNRLLWMQRKYKIGKKDRILQKTPYSFDVSVWELILPYLSGGRLYFAKPEGHKDPLYLCEEIEKHKITTIHFVPSMLNTFVNVVDEEYFKKLKSLRRIFCSGEGLSTELAQRCLKLIDCELHNLYGPTEASIDVSYWDCKREEYRDRPVEPIGRAIDNIKLYILNEKLKPVPIGVSGELYIGGVGLARKYLNREKLTKERFITNPFILEKDKRQKRNLKLYKTGDLVRWLPDGNIEYLGRTDFQVKLRGFRIELGEIEANLAKYPGINQVVITVYEEKELKQLVTYYTLKKKKEKDLKTEELKKFLEKQLPEYMIMIPSIYVRLKEFPLTSSGKIDRKALPIPSRQELITKQKYIAPRNAIENELQQVWSMVLKIEKRNISIIESFFDIGGDSLSAVNLMLNINRAFGLRNPVVWIFTNNSIEKQAEAIKESSSLKIKYEPIVGFNEEGKNPPLFFIHPGQGGAETYFELAKHLDKLQPFYAIESYNLYSNKKFLSTIEELASQYIKYIQKIEPKGPYYLGGWCFGGNIAFEIAHQLTKKGYEIAHLFLIDAFMYVKQAKKLLINLADSKLMEEVFNQDPFFVQLPKQYKERLKKVSEYEYKAIYAYDHKFFAGEATLFKATKKDEIPSNADPSIIEVNKKLTKILLPQKDNSWGKVLKKVKIIPLMANHQTIMVGENIQKIANYINKEMARKKT